MSWHTDRDLSAFQKTMIIDSHTHVDEVEAWGWIDPPEVLLPLLDQAGIEKAIIMSYRDAVTTEDPAVQYVKDAVDKYPERLIGYIRINAESPQAGEILDLAIQEYKFKGVKLHPVSYVGYPYGENTVRLIKRASQYQAPILFHSGDEPLALPQELAEAARLCPEATLIFAHIGGYFHCEAAIRAAERYENIYLDTSGMPYPGVISEAVERIGSERVIFGSDGPGCLPALEVDKVKMAGLSPGQEENVFTKNIMRILRGVNHDV